MIALYRLLTPFVALIALPMLFLQGKRRGGYGGQWKNLFGFTGPIPPKQPERQRIWIQAASVGELLSIAPLIQALAARPGTELFLTTTTATGLRVAHGQFGRYAAYVGAFPVDLWPVSARTWSRFQPDVAVLVDSELWPEHLRQAQRRRVPVYLINARMSERSFARYRRLRGIVRPLLRPLTAILAATESDRQRYAALDLAAAVHLTGNLKFGFNPEPILDTAAKTRLLRECGLMGQESPGTPEQPPTVLLGASTWPGEEVLLVEAFDELRKDHPDLRLILVPRHAERREEISRSLAARAKTDPALRPVFRSQTRGAAPTCLVYIADTTGELRRFLQTATIVFIGKSMPPHTDGQSPLEAIAYGKPVLMGPGMKNFADIAATLLARNAAHPVAAPAGLSAVLRSLVEDPESREILANAGRAWFDENRGAVERILGVIP